MELFLPLNQAGEWRVIEKDGGQRSLRVTEDRGLQELDEERLSRGVSREVEVEIVGIGI